MSRVVINLSYKSHHCGHGPVNKSLWDWRRFLIEVEWIVDVDPKRWIAMLWATSTIESLFTRRRKIGLFRYHVNNVILIWCFDLGLGVWCLGLGLSLGSRSVGLDTGVLVTSLLLSSFLSLPQRNFTNGKDLRLYGCIIHAVAFSSVSSVRYWELLRISRLQWFVDVVIQYT